METAKDKLPSDLQVRRRSVVRVAAVRFINQIDHQGSDADYKRLELIRLALAYPDCRVAVAVFPLINEFLEAISGSEDQYDFFSNELRIYLMNLINRVLGIDIKGRKYLGSNWSGVEILANAADRMPELVREYFERALFTSIEQTFIASRLSKSSEEDVIKAARLIKYVPGRKDQRKLKQYFCYLVLPGITINGGILSQKLQEVKLELCPSLWERVKRLFTPKN